jgi:hypothetical protein
MLPQVTPQHPARVIVCPDPFDLLLDPAKIREVQENETLADLAPTGPGAWLCFVNSDPIPRALWHYLPPVGSLVQFRCLPQGGGKDNGGSLRAVLTIVAMIAITFFTAGAATGFALQALRFGLQLAATALINNLIPVEGPKANSGSPQYSAQAQGNIARLGAPIPEIFGFDNGYPELACQPYSFFIQTGERSINTEQYLHVLLMVGSGQYHICRVSVGDTNILTYDEVEIVRIGPNQSTIDGPGTGVENIGDQTIVDPLWITSPDVMSIEMRPVKYVGPYTACPPERQVDIIGVDIMLPKGLVQESGMSWRVEARLIDDFEVAQGAWVVLGTHTETDESNVPVRMGFDYPVATGRYEVRVIRTDGTTNPNLAELDQLDWMSLRGHLVDADINVTGCTFIAIKIRATGQLSGGLRFRVMSRRMLPVWDGSVWSDPVLTRSPAWAFAQVLRSRGIPDASIDLDALVTLAPLWEARYDSFDYKFDTQTSTWEALALIAKVGRAIPLIRGSRYTVVRDGPETLPVAAYGMRNIRRGSMSLSPTLAASDSMRTLDAEYFDHRRWNWITVTSQIHNGQIYTYRGEVERAALGIPVPDENRRGRIKFSGIIGENHAKRTVAYTLADAYYRSASVSIDTELDGQLPAPLNLVLFQHDVGDFGQSGDVVSWDEVDTIETTEPLRWSDGAHAIRLQKPDGSLTSAITVTQGVDDHHAVLGSAPGFTLSTEDANRERTRYVFGPQTQVGALCKVRSITPSDDRKFGLRLVLEDSRVHTVDAAFIAEDPLPPCVVEESTEPLEIFRDEFIGGGLLENHTPDVAPAGFVWGPTPSAFSEAIVSSGFAIPIGTVDCDSHSVNGLSISLHKPWNIEITGSTFVATSEPVSIRILSSATSYVEVGLRSRLDGDCDCRFDGYTDAKTYTVSGLTHTMRARMNADDTVTTYVDGVEQETFAYIPPETANDIKLYIAGDPAGVCSADRVRIWTEGT